MSLFLLDVASGPIIIIALIVVIIVIGSVIGLISVAIIFIKRIKKEEDEKFFNEHKEDE